MSLITGTIELNAGTKEYRISGGEFSIFKKEVETALERWENELYCIAEKCGFNIADIDLLTMDNMEVEDNPDDYEFYE